MTELKGKALKVFKSAAYPKFLATVDGSQVPNVVPVLTLKATDGSKLIFARMMVWKTARNLEDNGIATVACMGPGRSVWTVKGQFEGFVKSGPYTDEFQDTFLFRYNAYAGAEQVGVIRVKELLPAVPMNWLRTLATQRSVQKAAAGIGGNGSGPMPPQVVGQFNRKAVLKYMAHVGADGWPLPRPAFTLFPAGRSAMIFDGAAAYGMEEGARMAACVISTDMIAYQVKGRYRGAESLSGKSYCKMEVEEAFSASPPLPGKKIEGRK